MLAAPSGRAGWRRGWSITAGWRTVRTYRTVQEWLSHADVSTTMIYTHA